MKDGGDPMLMADVAIWTALFVGLMVVLPAVWLLFGALWPSAVQRAQERIPRKPYSTFFIGLGVTFLLTVLVGVLGQASLAPPALVIASFALGWSLLGVSALARHVGSRLASPGDPAWKPHLRGGIVLALSFLVPFLGWMLLFPVAIILGAGAATMAVFRRAPAPAPAPLPVPAKPEPAKEEILA
jgi:hypothetical protein